MMRGRDRHTLTVEKERPLAAFDFPAFKRAFEAQDVEAWLAFFAPDAEWREYRPDAPPRSPKITVGTEAIRARLTYIAGLGIEQAISDEVIGEERIAFAFLVTEPDGRHLIEHVILHLADGKIARQVEVEAWD
jgi:ketosteroid isomerase-like protein